MHHKKHENRHQLVSSSHHYRLATRSSTLIFSKSIKVKRLINTSITRNDETRLTNGRSIECHQHSTPVTTGNIASIAQNIHSSSSTSSSSSSSSPFDIFRRRATSTSNMTSYSALKRKAQRSDVSSNISRFQVNLEHVLGFTSISNSLVSQDHSTIAYAAGSTVVLYDIHTQKQDFIINTARKAITSLSLSPDGRYLATGECGHDPKVRIWDLTGDKTVSIELGDHTFAIDNVCFSPNVDRLVSIGSLHDGNIYVWSWKDKKKLASNKCTCAIRRVAFAEDGSYFVTVGNRHVKFWYLISTSALEVVPLRGRYAILAERKDNLFTDVVCGRGDCAGMTYVVTANGLICQFDEHRQMCGELDLHEKANCLTIGDLYLVVGCVNGAVYIFSPQTLDYIMSIPLPHYLGVDIAFITSIDQMTYPHPQQQNMSFPDTIAICLDEDKSVLACFYNDHSFYVWDLVNERSIKKRDSHLYHSGCGWGIETYSRTNTTSSIPRNLSCITCSSDNSIRFWSLNHSENDSHSTPSSSSSSSSSYSSNIFSRQLIKIIYLDNDYSKLCDSQTTQERPEFVPKIGGRCMKINPDGYSLAIGDRNGNIRIFNMELLQQIALIEAHDSEVLSIDYSYSSDMGVTFLASSSRDRFVHIFDVTKDYQLVATLDDHSAAITAVRFTFSSITSNLQLISCSADKSLIFRSIVKNENGKYQFIRSNNIVEKQTFYDLGIDHKREFVSTACQDRMIRVYNLQDGKRVRTCKGSIGDDTGYLIKIDIDTTGRYLATSCSNKCVYIWDTITNECVASLCGHSEIVTDLKFSQDGHYLYTISGDSCIFAWNIIELAIVPTTCRIQPLPSTKSTDLELTEADESISQTSNVNDESQQNSKRQRSLWATIEPSLPSFETKFLQTQISDDANEDSINKMVASTSSQEDTSTFLDEDDDQTFSSTTNGTNRKMNAFFTENYDHENLEPNTIATTETVASHEIKSRKSVSARFRSISKDLIMPDTLLTSMDTNQENISLNSSTTANRQSKSVQSRAIITTTNESKISSSKLSTTGKIRINRTRSEDRFRGSSLSLLNNITDTTSASSSNSQLPSYAAHTSSSMNKLRENSTSVTSPPPVASLLPSSSNSSLAISSSSSQARRIPSVISVDTRSSSNKNMSKSRSTQNLILPTAMLSNYTAQKAKLAPSRRLKVPRRPPNLPTTVATINTQSSSSSSSNNSSPSKSKQHLPPCLQDSILPLRELDNSTNDLMPKWAQDCFYRTVVLGLKPLLLQDIPASPLKHSTSTSSIESSDSLETTSELVNSQKQIKIRRSVSISDYKQIETKTNKENNSISNDHRMPIINHLVSDLHKHLNELENFYSTVSQSSDKHDLNIKQYIEQIYTDLHIRVTNNHQQQNQTAHVVNN
ncbi:unnamed protein product [Rotaria socialis]|uniref:MABP1/WDR62 second WD40 domain-containing protein n=1 Tax=Rotaria socialis TaxID=392032 RepID=A0A817TUB8_9BILA|nr:unnamed protein product [Rotaria socialis]CAF4201310.1 unnamed protein product [Rotaria socialis]